MVVPLTPRVNPLSVLYALSTPLYAISSSPISITPVVGKPNTLSTTIDVLFNVKYDNNKVIG